MVSELGRIRLQRRIGEDYQAVVDSVKDAELFLLISLMDA